MAKQTITALFDSREYANNAALMLRQDGIPDADIQISPATTDMTTATTATTETKGKGFWGALEDMFGGYEDHGTYTEGLRRGGTMVVAHVDDAKVADAVSILERHGSVDLDERETSWRSEGWSGGTALTGAAVTGGGVASQGAGPLRSLERVEDDTEIAASRAMPVATGTAATPARTPAALGASDEVIQVVEEDLSVGKRAVNRGKVRIHSYVVEKNVSENVTLRDETVTIDRRPVDRPLAAGELGVDAFRERTIEMDEIDEEAVVAKTARVVEEIGIRKDVTDRVQTVSDSVRSTKVEVEDGRGVGRTATGLMGDFTTRLAADMVVVGSDGGHVGVIDHVEGASIKLKRMDPASGGQHHLIPVEWVSDVSDKVTLKTTAADAKSRWSAA